VAQAVGVIHFFAEEHMAKCWIVQRLLLGDGTDSEVARISEEGCLEREGHGDLRVGALGRALVGHGTLADFALPAGSEAPAPRNDVDTRGRRDSDLIMKVIFNVVLQHDVGAVKAR
jgi:hypothetical protein